MSRMAMHVLLLRALPRGGLTERLLREMAFVIIAGLNTSNGYSE
jgi:hypothetical protein